MIALFFPLNQSLNFQRSETHANGYLSNVDEVLTENLVKIMMRIDWR